MTEHPNVGNDCIYLKHLPWMTWTHASNQRKSEVELSKPTSSADAHQSHPRQQTDFGTQPRIVIHTPDLHQYQLMKPWRSAYTITNQQFSQNQSTSLNAPARKIGSNFSLEFVVYCSLWNVGPKNSHENNFCR